MGNLSSGCTVVIIQADVDYIIDTDLEFDIDFLILLTYHFYYACVVFRASGIYCTVYCRHAMKQMT